jgi:hypothetical protein
VGTRAGLDTVVKRKYPCLYWELYPSSPARSLDTILTELPQLYFVTKVYVHLTDYISYLSHTGKQSIS